MAEFSGLPRSVKYFVESEGSREEVCQPVGPWPEEDRKTRAQGERYGELVVLRSSRHKTPLKAFGCCKDMLVLTEVVVPDFRKSPSHERLSIPTKAKSANGVWHLVVNQRKDR